MKKIFNLLLILLFSSSMSAQIKKPTIMVVPSDVWCIQNNYLISFDNNGTSEQLPDYAKALQSDANLLLAISKINTLMADRGFPLKDLSSVIKSLKQQEAEEQMLQSKTSGAMILETPLDRLKKTAKADIIIDRLTEICDEEEEEKLVLCQACKTLQNAENKFCCRCGNSLRNG